MPKTLLRTDQIRAIAFAKDVGKLIAENHPLIADDYKNGKTQEEIVSNYDLVRENNITEKIAITAVRYALNELLQKKELQRLEYEHQQKGGIETVVNGGAKKGGQSSYEQHVGVHALSHQEKVSAGREGGLKGGCEGVLAKGLTPWLPEEKECFLDLCTNPSYLYGSGLHLGQPNYNQIADELEDKFGILRTPIALKRAYARLKIKNS
jgi:hypothetical protein